MRIVGVVLLLQTKSLNVTKYVLVEMEKAPSSLNSQNGCHGVEDCHLKITMNGSWLERQLLGCCFVAQQLEKASVGYLLLVR